MSDKVVALSEQLCNLDLIYTYIPLNHYTMKESVRKNKVYIVAPKKFFSTIFQAGCFADVVLYEGELQSYLAGSQVITDNFLIIDNVTKDSLQEQLQVKTSPLDRFNVYADRLKLLRAFIHDRAAAVISRNHGIHAVIFPDLAPQMEADLFAYLHNKLHIQSIRPIVLGDKRPTEMPKFSHYEVNVSYQRLLEIVVTARLCIGLPSAYTYLSIHLNIPTVIVLYSPEMPAKISAFWGHVRRAYCPQELTTDELLQQAFDAAHFFEYMDL